MGTSGTVLLKRFHLPGTRKGVYVAQVYDEQQTRKWDYRRRYYYSDGKMLFMDELQKLLEYYAKGDTADMKIMTHRKWWLSQQDNFYHIGKQGRTIGKCKIVLILDK